MTGKLPISREKPAAAEVVAVDGGPPFATGPPADA